MANQTLYLDLSPARTLAILAVDTADTAAQFSDFGTQESWVADADYKIVAVRGSGATAPATVNTLQVRKNASDRPLNINLASVFDPKSNQVDRLGSLLGLKIPRGVTFQLIGRA